MAAISLANIACGLLIIIYAWNRFNTPPTNRSSTRRVLYWWSCSGYILCALLLFAGLSILLHVTGFRRLLELEDQALPDPLLATLAMTTLLPSLPLLKDVDAWLLALFLDWGAIPAEARRRAAAMTPHDFAVSDNDLRELRRGYEGEYGETFTKHLRDQGEFGLARSQLRFTRVMKLFDQIDRLAAQSRYERFFSESSSEFAAIKEQIAGFARRAVASLDRAAAAPKQDTIAGNDISYKQFIAEWHERFAQDCRDNFIMLTRFLASAVLRAEATERDIVARLQKIGFTSIEPMNMPEFPINSLTLLGLGIGLYLVVGTVAFSYRAGGIEHMKTGLMLAAQIGAARLATIALTIWLMQRYPFFRRESGQQRPYFAYLVNAIFAGIMAGGVCGLFDLVDKTFPGVQDVRISILSGMTCFVIALCCDSWSADTDPPRWLRPTEALACGATMAMGTLFFYFLDLAPSPGVPGLSPALLLTIWIALPSTLAMVIGGFVPHIYRAARRAAAARRDEAARLAAMPQYEPRRLIAPAEAPTVASPPQNRRSLRHVRRATRRAA
jgi:hypothetical protein